MNPATIVARWYRQSAAIIQARDRYTAEEVLRLLRPSDGAGAAASADGASAGADVAGAEAARRETVRQAAARPAAWAELLSRRERAELGALADRLPTLIFQHARGGSVDELVRRHGGWGTWRYEQALHLAGQCIARHLNGGRAA